MMGLSAVQPAPSRSMKILLLNWRDITHPQAGGAEKYVHEIGKRLARNHSVTLLAGRYPGSPQTENIDGIEVIRKGGRFSLYLRSAAFLLAHRKDYDIVIDDINGVPFFSPLFAKAPVIAVVHHIVGWTIFKKELAFPMSVAGYLGERCIPTIYSDCPFITVSESSRGELIEFGVDKGSIGIIENGIDLPVPPFASLDPQPRVVYLGRIKDYKRVDHVILAFETVKRKVPGAKLTIAGRGDIGELRRIAAERSLEDSIAFLEEIDEGLKREVLASAWVLVTASMKEGWSISVMEANAYGTPAIAYDVPGLRDSIIDGKTGILVPEGDIDALAEAITRVLEDQELRARLSNNALVWARNFNWDQSAERFARLIEKTKDG